MGTQNIPDLDYSATDIAVREDLREAHSLLWDHLSRPGRWWSGAERVAIASETRHAPRCALCADRKQALSPEHVPGEHESVADLSANIVEVVHRIRTDPARLSRGWFDERIAAGLSEEEYVEIVGVVTLTTGAELFCRALGIPPFALPEPQTGTPSRTRPSGARDGTAWVSLLAPQDAGGADADLYNGVDDPPNIMRALSLVPEEARALQRSSDAHYVAVADIADPTVRRAIDRMQMELVASRVSALNECFY